MSSVLRVYLSVEDRERLLKLTHSGKAVARMISRAQILLLVDRNQPNWKKHREVVEVLQTSLARVSRVSRRYVLEGLDAALSEEPRSGTPPKMTGEIEAQLSSWRVAIRLRAANAGPCACSPNRWCCSVMFPRLATSRCING